MKRLGLDAGGTWARLALFDEESGRLRRLRLPSAPPERLDGPVRRALRRWGLRRVDLLVAASTGVWEPAARRALARRLSPLAARVKALSDLELARAAAFDGGPGVLVVSGTGSAALAADARGRLRRSGGLGPLLGDDGSAFRVGKAWLSGGPEASALRLARRTDCVRAVAALAKTVLSRARRGDRRALAILREAARALARQAQDAARSMPSPAPLSWAGGMLRDRLFRSLFLRALPPRRFAPRAPRAAPEVFAARAGKLIR